MIFLNLLFYAFHRFYFQDFFCFKMKDIKKNSVTWQKPDVPKAERTQSIPVKRKKEPVKQFIANIKRILEIDEPLTKSKSETFNDNIQKKSEKLDTLKASNDSFLNEELFSDNIFYISETVQKIEEKEEFTLITTKKIQIETF